MMKKIIDLFFKYKAPILYIVFGGITTVINIVTYWLCYDIIGINNDISNILAWLFSVLVAYITNKIWVFESVTNSFLTLMREMLSFVSCRIATGLIDLAIMHAAVVMLHLPGVPFKIIANVIVIILNYVASKLFIFRKDSKK